MDLTSGGRSNPSDRGDGTRLTLEDDLDSSGDLLPSADRGLSIAPGRSDAGSLGSTISSDGLELC